jgi:hypothetical protein
LATLKALTRNNSRSRKRISEQSSATISGLSMGGFSGETRREHLAELQAHCGLRPFGFGQYRSLAAWLMRDDF